MSNFDFVSDSMMEMYLFESTTLLEQLDVILLVSEKNRTLSQESIDEIFRIMHTIKGSSAMMEFNSISFTSHKLEDLFFVIREKGISDLLFNELFDLVLKVSDFLKSEVDKVQSGEPLSNADGELNKEVVDFLNRLSKNENSDVLVKNTDEIRNPSPSVAPKGGKGKEKSKMEKPDNVLNLKIMFTQDCQMENIRAFMILNLLEPLGNVLATEPSELNLNPDASAIIARDGFMCMFSSNVTKQEILGTVSGTLSVLSCEFIENEDAIDFSESENIEATGQDINSEEDEKESKEDKSQKLNVSKPSDASNSSQVEISEILKTGAGKQNLISVDLNKLDLLMDLVGEIVITESMVSGNPDLDGLELDSFHKSSRQLRKLTDELQGIVMSIRMVPISATFQKMHRIVRDMNKKLGKEVDLVILGEGTEVDKTIIDGLGDPLMHLVRNAMDHGIEDRNARAASGKNPVGQLILSAQNSGGDIVISVSDNGKGLDPSIILKKAIENDLLTKPASEMTEREIFNLLTLPGFSTKESVTEFSGRGVGMDVVKKNIEKIGGTVSIESKLGIGTTVMFKIPLTLAIIDGMEIKAGKNLYTFPISNIR